MTKFKVGDTVVYKHATRSCHTGELELLSINPGAAPYSSHGVRQLGGEHFKFYVGEGVLELIKRGDPMDNLKQGDVLVRDDYEDRTVQGLVGDVVFQTYRDSHVIYNTIDELKETGWHLKDSTDTTELTIEDIAKKFKLKPEQVRIKKED